MHEMEVSRGRGEPWGLLSSVLPGKSTQQNSAQFGGGGGRVVANPQSHPPGEEFK